MSEINAALGLLQLKHIDQALARRGAIDARYRERLRGVAGHPLPRAAPGERAPTTPTSRSWSAPTIRFSRDALYERLRDARHPWRAATSTR